MVLVCFQISFVQSLCNSIQFFFNGLNLSSFWFFQSFEHFQLTFKCISFVFLHYQFFLMFLLLHFLLVFLPFQLLLAFLPLQLLSTFLPLQLSLPLEILLPLPLLISPVHDRMLDLIIIVSEIDHIKIFPHHRSQREEKQVKLHQIQSIQVILLYIIISLQILIQSLMDLSFRVEVPRPQQAELKSNYISTTKYNIFTFLPLSLILQFKRYANIYFLIEAVMQSIPLISPLNPASAVAPLAFVLALSMIREGVQDFKRWRSDQRDNSQITHRFQGNSFHKCKWEDLKAGDFVRIEKEETISADVLVLLSSSPSGISYVETASLDGQKNLKPKFSSALLQKYVNHTNQSPHFQSFMGQVLCIQPTASVDAFEGQIQLKYNELNLSDSLNKKNMMLRGCKLKNTDWAIGVVIYTGDDTAIMMNSSNPVTKTSNIESQVNNIILIVFAFEALCCVGSAIYGYFECRSNLTFVNYITSESIDCIRQAGIALGSYFILFSTFIPISLIVSIQFVKVFQGYFMSTDKQMFCNLNQRSMACRTVSINEQLGQVEYILTDKTGTLTCNQMEFRNVVIGKDMYGQELAFDPVGVIDYEYLVHRKLRDTSINPSFDGRGLSYDLSGSIEEQNNPKSSKRQLIELMFTMIATCHECIVNNKGQFEGPSPDEVALLKAAANVGFKFVSSQNKTIRVNYQNNSKEFQLLKLIEFDSDRKRMTVVVRSQESTIVFTKGADTSIEKILAPKQRYLLDIKHKTNEMTKTGLRSLWFAYKTYPKNEDISRLSDQEIESNLNLVGATGIEDRLQDFVPQTIFSLREGGIKFVMLTGDKLETAENIALSCKLIEEGFLIRGIKDLEHYIRHIDECFINMQELYRSPVIDGSTLSFTENQLQLQYVIEKAKSVVFCRVTPGQKAEIVRFVKNMGKLTLAIGDGANDVNMIMEANVGVGIYGEEGTRAAQVANYAIGQFCLLWKLILYHGRLNYIRIAEMILYFFYKNMVFTTVQFIYSFYSLGSGQSFWLSWSITFYNMIFTLFPVVIRAVFEVDVMITPTKETFDELSRGTHQQQTLYSYYPKMYFISQQNKLFGKLIFFAWFFLGFCQGVICLLLTIYALGDENDSSGLNSFQSGLYLVQISAYTSVIIVVTVKIAVSVKNWTIILFIGFLVPSIGLYVAFTFVQGSFEDTVTYDSMPELLSMPSFYIIQILCVGGMFAFDFLLYSLKTTKESFQNYLKFKTLKRQRLSQTNLKKYMLEMYETRDRNLSL